MKKKMESRLRQKLEEAFSPLLLLDIINESHKHKGHSGSPETGESHFKIRIKSPVFDDLSRIASHQLIYKALSSEFKLGLHALSLEILS